MALGAGYGKSAVNDEGGNTTNADAVNSGVLLADVIHVFTRIDRSANSLHRNLVLGPNRRARFGCLCLTRGRSMREIELYHLGTAPGVSGLDEAH